MYIINFIMGLKLVITSTVGTSILSNLENDNNSKKSRKLQDLLSRKPSRAAVDDKTNDKPRPLRAG